MNMQLHLNQEEIEFIMNSLAQHPYIQVHEIIEKVRSQAEAQLRHRNGPQATSFDSEPVLHAQEA